MEDRREQEELTRASGLRWTIFKPPRLTMGAPHRHVIIGPHVRSGLLSHIPRADLARLLIEEVEHSHFRNRTVFLRGSIL